MTRKPAVLITGANGEIGHGLITALAAEGDQPIVTIDLTPLDPSLTRLVAREFTGSILDKGLLERLISEFEVDRVFHLAALLSTRGEFSPKLAHQVNVEGTLQLLEFAQRQGESHGRPVVVHLPVVDCRLRPARSRDAGPGRRRRRGRLQPADDDVRLQQALLRAARPLLRPVLQAARRRARRRPRRLPLPALPGLISAMTMPAGGTSDYAPEMIHAAAKGESYACFVRPDTRIPFMAMPDGIDALRALAAVPRERLTRTAYNVRAFNPSAAEMRRHRPARVSRGRHRVPGRREAPGHRRFVARRRQRRGRPARLGLRSAVRPRIGLRRLPDPHHPRPLRPALSRRRGPRPGPRPRAHLQPPPPHAVRRWLCGVRRDAVGRGRDPLVVSLWRSGDRAGAPEA